MGEPLGEPEDLADALDSLEASSGGESLNPGGGGIMGRLMSTTPDPNIEGVESWKITGKDMGLKYLKRGVGKFTGAGGTAFEDFAMAAVNLTAWFWGKLTTSNVGDEPERAD